MSNTDFDPNVSPDDLMVNAPGTFTETVPKPPQPGKGNPFTRLTADQELAERARLNFESARIGSVVGAALAAEAATTAEGPAFSPDQVPSGGDLQNAPFGVGTDIELAMPTEARQEAAKKRIEDIQADMLSYKTMRPWSGVVEGATALGGQLAGGATSPENLVFPQARFLSPIFRATRPFISDVIQYGLGQAIVQGVADPIKQALQVRAGVRKEIDVAETAFAIPAGFVFGGGITALSKGASIVYRAGLDAWAGRLTQRLPDLTPELRAPVLPEPEAPPVGIREQINPVRDAQVAREVEAARIAKTAAPEGEAPTATPEQPASRIFDRRERDNLLTQRDDLEVAMMNEADGVQRAAMQARLSQIEDMLTSNRVIPAAARPDSIRTEAVAPPRETVPPGGESIAPRLKEMRTTGAGAAPGMDRPMTGGIDSPDRIVSPVENLSGAMRRVSEALDITVRKGPSRRDSSATYNFETQIVRLTNATPNSYVDWAHELGHHVENAVGPSIRNLINSNASTMQALAGPSVSGRSAADVAREGFGEFMADYITNNSVNAINKDPAFLGRFLDIMRNEAPDLLRGLEEAKAAWQAYQAAPSRAVGEAMVVSRTEIPEKPDYKDPLKRGPVGLWMSNIYTQMVNRQHPMSVAVRYLASSYEKKYGRLLNLPSENDPAQLMQMFGRGGHGMTIMDLTYGVQDAHTLRPSGPSFFSILRRVAADPVTGVEAADGAAAARMKAFDSYLIARWHRALRQQMNTGLSDLKRPPTRLTDGDAAQIISEAEAQYPNFRALAEEVYSFNKELLKKEYDAHLRTRESLDELMLEHNHEYVPLRRDMREISEDVRSNGFGDTKGLERLQQHWERAGSDRDVLSPTESIMLRTGMINDQMMENWIKLSLRDLARTVGGKEAAHIVEEIPNTKLRALDIDGEEAIFQMAKKNGWTTQDARDFAQQVVADVGPSSRVTLYSSQAIKAGSRPIIFGWDRGERFALQLPDGDFGRQLQEVMDSIGPHGAKTWAQASGLLVDVLAMSAGTLRAGATGTPTFMVKNTLRDAFMQYLMIPEADTLGTLTMSRAMRGGKSYLQGDDFYRMYVSTEGIRGGIAANTIADTRKVGDMLRSAGIPDQKVLTFGHVKDVLSAMEISESAGRIGVFRSVYENNIAMGRSERYAMFDAAQKARDFIDYSRVGSSMELFSRLVPFLNANVQGLDKFVRTYVGTPTNPGLFFKPLTVQQAEKQAAIRTTLLPRVAALATISAALTFLQKDDPVYQRIPLQTRSQYWIFRLPFLKSGTYDMASGGKVHLPEGMQGAWIVLPKPWEPATVFNMAERAVEFLNTGDPQYMKTFLSSMRYTLSIPMPYELPMIRTAAGLASNYDTFFQRPIISDSLQKVAPHLQATEYTNKFYVAIARGLNMAWNSKDARDFFRENIPVVGAAIGAMWSPMEAQYLMQGVFGDWPRELGGIGGLARSMFTGEAAKMEDVPALRALIKTKMAGGEPMRELYNQIGQNGGRLTVASETMKKLIADGDFASAQQYFSALDSNQRDYVRLKQSVGAPLAVALHPLERTAAIASVVRNVRDGLNADGGLATLADPKTRIKIEPGAKGIVVEALGELAATEARNSLIIQNVPGFKGKPLVDSQPYLKMIAEASPELAREISARMAQKKVYEINTVQEFWPDVQRTLRIGGEPQAISTALKGIAIRAAAQGYYGGGRKLGTGAVDSSGARASRPKRQGVELPAEGGVQ